MIHKNVTLKPSQITLYARVDMFENPEESGTYLLSELEVTEPSLYPHISVAAIEALANALMEQCKYGAK